MGEPAGPGWIHAGISGWPCTIIGSSSSTGVGDRGRLRTGNNSGRGLSVPLDLFHSAHALQSVPRHWGVSTSPQFVHCLSPSAVRAAKRVDVIAGALGLGATGGATGGGIG